MKGSALGQTWITTRFIQTVMCETTRVSALEWSLNKVIFHLRKRLLVVKTSMRGTGILGSLLMQKKRQT